MAQSIKDRQVLVGIRRLLAMPRLSDPETARIIAFLYGAHLAVAVCGSALVLLGFLLVKQEAWLLLGASLTALLTTLWSYALLRRGYVQISGSILSVAALFVVTGAGLLGASVQPVVATGYLVVTFLAGLLVGWRAALLCGILSLVSVFGVHAAAVSGAERTALGWHLAWSSVLPAIGAIVSATALVVYLVRWLGVSTTPAPQRESDALGGSRHLSGLDESYAARLELVQGAVGLATQIVSLSERDEIARRSVELVYELFTVEWAGLFLRQVAGVTDRVAEDSEEPYVVLAASAGSVDAALALPGERLALSANPALALCMRRGEGRAGELGRLGLGASLGKLAPRADSVLLLPLCAGEGVLGVLALCASPAGEGATGEMDIAQLAADQIAVALHRARVCADLRSAAILAERAVQRHVESSWDAVAASASHVTGYRYTPHQTRADDSAWLPPMGNAVRNGMLVIGKMASDSVLAAPLLYSGVVIGAAGLRRPATQPWTEDEKLLVQAVIDQVTQALENRRLFEFARDRAQRERVLRRLTERVRAQADLDGALAAAGEQIREITGATQVAIRLVRPGEFSDTERGSGQRAESDG